MKYTKKITFLLLIILLVFSLTACSILIPQDVKTDFTKYHVLFEVDGADYAQVKMIRSDATKIVMPNNPVKDGYDFIGWVYKGTDTPFTQKEFDELKTSIRSTINSVSVEAKFVKGKYTITFNSIYGEQPYSTFLIDTKVEFTGIEKPIDPVYDPCIFIGWYQDPEYKTLFDFNVNPHKSMTVYAKWDVPEYTITFDADSCGVIAPIVAKFGESIVAPTLEERAGLVFNRFYVKEGKNNITFVFDKMPKDGATVYAEWTTTSTINYKFGDKVLYTINDHPTSELLNIMEVAPGNECYLPDYHFIGWYEDQSLTTEIKTPTIGIDKSVVNIYGKYKNRSFLDNLAVFRDKGNSDLDPINLSTDDELVQLIDYVLTFDLKEANRKYFTLKTLASPYTEISLKNKINENFAKITSVNNGIGYSYSKDGMGPIGIYSSLDDSAIDIKTENPIRYTQVKTGLIPILDTKRDSAFDNFNYNEYPLYEDKISTSNQLFYILQYGYKPQCVTGSVAEDMLNKAKAILKDCVNDTMDNFDKVYAIYCWLVQNVDYDNKALIDEKASTNPNYTNKCEAWHLEGVFNSHLAVCDGISKAMVVLCRLEGIPCIRIAGPGHAWNKVYLDVDGEKEGKPAWYSIDATWGDTALEGDGQSILNLDSFLHKDSDKVNKGVLYDCHNHKDIVANTDTDVYSEITFKFEGKEYDLHISNKSETLVLKKYLNSLGPGRKSICVDIDYSGFGLDFGTYSHIDIDKANKIYLIIIE